AKGSRSRPLHETTRSGAVPRSLLRGPGESLRGPGRKKAPAPGGTGEALKGGVAWFTVRPAGQASQPAVVTGWGRQTPSTGPSLSSLSAGPGGVGPAAQELLSQNAHQDDLPPLAVGASAHQHPFRLETGLAIAAKGPLVKGKYPQIYPLQIQRQEGV